MTNDIDQQDKTSYIESIQRNIDRARAWSYPVGQLSDGYHTFDELYAHRYILWVKLCEMMYITDKTTGDPNSLIKAKKNHDGTEYVGYFILGYTDPTSKKQISYHLPMKYWDMCYFSKEYDIYPDYDGHTSTDVLTRLSQL